MLYLSPHDFKSKKREVVEKKISISWEDEEGRVYIYCYNPLETIRLNLGTFGVNIFLVVFKSEIKVWNEEGN